MHVNYLAYVHVIAVAVIVMVCGLHCIDSMDIETQRTTSKPRFIPNKRLKMSRSYKIHVIHHLSPMYKSCHDSCASESDRANNLWLH